MVIIFDKKGNPLSVHPIDARDIIKSGSHFYVNPMVEVPIEEEKVGPPPENSNLDDLSKEQLVEYAMLYYKMKLKNSWGEQRMRNELKMSKQLKEQEDEENDDEESDNV